MFKFFSHNFKKFDKFDIPISFRHKKEDTYTTWIGGLFTVLLVGCALVFFIIYIIPFIKKKNYSLDYYTINLKKTQKINFGESKAALAIGFEYNKKYNIDDLLELTVIYNKYSKGHKDNDTINLHNCNETDFYNDENLINSIDNDKFKNLKCFDNLSNVIENRYQDKNDNFSYYQIDIKIKEGIDPSIAEEFLIDNDCKIELYYIDVNNEFEDFKNPIKKFVYEIFLQLNPDVESRMNIYFMNSYFENNNDLLFETTSDKKQNTLFSRAEQYYLHRTSNIIGKIYIRADTRKMIVKRTYQTLTEFFAVTFSLWEDLFLICNIALNTYNRFCLNYSISKKLFFFEGIDDTHFNFAKNKDKIKELIRKTNDISVSVRSSQLKTFVRTSTKNQHGNINDTDRKTIYNEDNKTDLENNESEQTLNRLVLILKRFLDFLNFFECKCCKSRKLEKRTILFSNAEDIINAKLDIINYLKSILLLDMFKDIAMDDKKEMLNFLCMPFISSNREEKLSYYHYHNNFSDDDLTNLSHEIEEFIAKKPFKLSEKKLISLINHRLRRYIKEKNLIVPKN